MSLFYRFFLVFIDIVLLNVSIGTVFYLNSNIVSTSDWAFLIIYSNIAWLFLILVSSPYGLDRTLSTSKIVRSQLSFIFIHLLIVISLNIFFGQHYGLWQIILIYPIFLIGFVIVRILSVIIYKEIGTAPKTRNYIVLGLNTLGREIRKFYLLRPELGYSFRGYVDFENSNFDSVKEIMKKYEIHEIFCCVKEMNKANLDNLVEFALDSLIKVKIFTHSIHVGDSMNIRVSDFDINLLDDKPALALDAFGNQVLKRVFDLFAASLFCLLVLSWLVPLVGLLIKLESKGPIFFIQKRNGQGNIPFGCLKFRTMVVNKEADSKQATKDDPRITKVGGFLRKTSLDEVPQFINVLIGNMSLIGPRPHPIKLNEKFAEKISIMMSRHYVKPGITGLAQCMGYRGETQELIDMENRVRMDRYYIENWTFWLDIKIIFLTVISLIRGSDKAY